MTITESLNMPSRDVTDLERRVLAHERVLQSLIAYMSRTEPHFIEHLKLRFVDSMRMVQREHDYRGADEYAEEFIRAVIQLGEAPAIALSSRGIAVEQDRRATVNPTPNVRPDSPARSDRVQVEERAGIWQVALDGVFHGDYHRKEYAVAAAALLKLSLK